MAESFRSAPETIALLISYTPIQNKKFKKKILLTASTIKDQKQGWERKAGDKRASEPVLV